MIVREPDAKAVNKAAGREKTANAYRQGRVAQSIYLPQQAWETLVLLSASAKRTKTACMLEALDDWFEAQGHDRLCGTSRTRAKAKE